MPDTTSHSELIALPIADLPDTCFANDGARKLVGTLRCPAAARAELHNITLLYHGHRPPEDVQNIEITLHSVVRASIAISESNQWVRFGKGCGGHWIFRMWGTSSADIGDGCTANGADCYVNEGGRLVIGDDCMFAEVFLHVGDNHAIFDIETLDVLNYRPNPSLRIQDHVWIASRATVLGDAIIGAGSIIAAGAVVKGDVPGCSLIAGVPGRVVKSGVSWTRSHNGYGAAAVAQTLASLANRRDIAAKS